MKQLVLTRRQVRQFDRAAIEKFEIHPLVLMENAARGAVDSLCQAGIDGTVIICCGPGNNGGDGLVMARHLHLRGFDARVLLFAQPEKLSQDAGANFRILQMTSVPITGCHHLQPGDVRNHISGANWIVDALLGTGARPPVREPLNWVLPILNESPARRLAIDIPTGLDCDTDQIDGPVFRAEITCSFVAQKPVMFTDTGKRYCGDIKILDIGAPPEVLHQVTGIRSNHDHLPIH